ncbi:hypothetical protein NDU88_004847 [Pleurodeles waltl]|uniref:Uncharacterized protein n=1 Tax=Pleurodeles waltl TaxID=8319 RepID=A0AAV7PM26_PLEWA|nr:hypothetical protein NDU88_004847 [Pleurodeles waltl]
MGTPPDAPDPDFRVSPQKEMTDSREGRRSFLPRGGRRSREGRHAPRRNWTDQRRLQSPAEKIRNEAKTRRPSLPPRYGPY